MSISNEPLESTIPGYEVTEVLADDAPADAHDRLVRADSVVNLIHALLHEGVEGAVLATGIGTYKGEDVELLVAARADGPKVGAQEVVPVAILLRPEQIEDVNPS